MNTNNLKVLILAAGFGRRMGPFSRMINKGLVPYNNKPLISHILNSFDEKSTEFIIALGHLGNQVKDYVNSVHADKLIKFVEIKNYDEGTTGPATTIQACSEYLKGGFLWVSCDTLFEFDYKNRMNENWIGVYPVDSNISNDYCWVERDGEKIVNVINKQSSDHAVDAFIGLMYACDDQYLNNLINRNAKDTFEGFEGLDLKAHTVRSWRDFGTYEKWEKHNSKFTGVSFFKPNEVFYQDNNHIVKYFNNANHVTLREKRAQENIAAMPDNVRVVGNFLVHDYATGDIIYNQYNVVLFKKMLDWCKETLWKSAPDNIKINNACKEFYYNKTMERVNQLRVKYPGWSEYQTVNNRSVKSLDTYLNNVDWNLLINNSDCKFIHGDLHFDNTIYNKEFDKFTAIDWRTDFSGELYGDVYYDLAKLLGGLYLNYKDVKNNLYSIAINNDNATIVVPTVNNVTEYEQILKEFVELQGWSWNKVKALVPIIYLNMSPLHENPFDLFLVALSQWHFSCIYDI